MYCALKSFIFFVVGLLNVFVSSFHWLPRPLALISALGHDAQDGTQVSVLSC